MEKLPKGWVEAQLIDILDRFENGSRPKGGVQGILEGIPSLGGEHLSSDGGFKFDKIKYIPIDFAANVTKGKIKDNDILIVKDGATTGKTSYVNEDFPFNEAFVNEHVFLCRTSKVVSSKYVFYFLWSSEGKNRILNNFTGTAQGGINKKFASNTLIPLPPLPEQQRIVNKLDVLFASLDATRSRLEKIPQLIRDFKQAVLTQAVTGKLTEEWRKGKDLEEWRDTTLIDVCDSITDGDHQAPPKENEGIPFLVISNVSKGYFDFEGVTRYVSRIYFENLKESRIPKKGDVLYTVTGSFGIALEINFTKDFCFQRHIAIIKPNPFILHSRFLTFFLNSPQGFSQANRFATGTAQKTVPLKGIRSFNICLPEMCEQTEIVRRVDALFAMADAIQEQYEGLKQKVDTLPQAILAKAFRGELVEQNPMDEPAEKLLQRIQAEKEKLSTKTKKKSSRKSIKKPSTSIAAEPKVGYGEQK